MNVQQTPLPGVGVRYDLHTFEGRQVAILARQDGTVELAVYQQDDPDTVAETVVLRPAERAALAQLLAAPRTPPDDEMSRRRA